MPRRTQATASRPSPTAPRSQYTRLEQRLVLLSWLLSLFGYEKNQDLLADMKEAEEGFGTDGRSYIYHRLVGRGGRLKVSPDELARYDDNIRSHLAAINGHRSEPVTLRYFQHLALLFTEVFLDWRFHHPGELLRRLNQFVRELNARKAVGEPPEPEFAASDLNRIAYWMATGSGKTLILHANYRQFLHYNEQALDNILLITPNEGLSEQHMREMTASGIPCERFRLGESGLGLSAPNTIRVIEITKLVEEKRGGGVTVPVEAFEGNNLILVDEGHKGAGGEAWRRFREALGQTGFTFEYSATFGQALTAARNDALTAEYGRAIVFDYSYRYFHGDGYGKDFYILNLKDDNSEEKTNLLLMGNLLSFYEQQQVFEEGAQDLRPYNLEKPLWVFVGSSVNAVYTENRRKRSDVLTVARFLHRVLENENGWAIQAIEQVLAGTTGLADDNGQDPFTGRFAYLRQGGTGADAIYRDLLAKVFHARGSSVLHLCAIRGQEGELGLKAGGAEDYFGLIYIGDTSAFRNLVREDKSGIMVEEDVIVDSLFSRINHPASPINILIGAKKFVEGWDSLRVSNMGLLNIGRSEGSEIIQIFGRGVRLKGLGRSLKRSSALPGSHPQHLRLLETLNVFAVRADYMAQFREYLEREGVDTSGVVEIPLAIRPNREFLGKGLMIPRVPEAERFGSKCSLVLALDKAATVRLDLSVRVESLQSVPSGITGMAMRAGGEVVIPSESLDLVDWEAVYINLLECKRMKGFGNLVIPAGVPRQLIESSDPRLYRLVAEESLVRPRSFAEVAALQEAVCTILRRYVEKYYRICQARWESANMVFTKLADDDPDFRDYVVRISRNEADLVTAVKQLIDEGQRIYETETRELPNIHFDRHLYQPLLLERDVRIQSEPPGLKPSEAKFVRDLREFVSREAGGLLAGKEVFLLRNLSRGKGIGFFESEGFYPDFILWVKHNSRQRIVFVEPHGMLREKAYWTSDKARLHERLRSLSQTWGERTGLNGVTLDSFIVSATPYNTLRDYYGDGNWTREGFAEKHILFSDDAGYCSKLFEGSLTSLAS